MLQIGSVSERTYSMTKYITSGMCNIDMSIVVNSYNYHVIQMKKDRPTNCNETSCAPLI